MRTQRAKSYLIATLAALAISFNGSVDASTIASAKAMGMGGAAVAFGQDTITTFYNPATACFVGCRADSGASTKYNHRDLFLSDRPSAALQHGRFHCIPFWDAYGEGGLNTLWDWNGTWAAAVQWNNYDQVHTHYMTALEDWSGDALSTDLTLKFNFRVEVLTTTVAYSPYNWLTLGVAANVYFTWLNITGLEQLKTLSVDPSDVTNQATATSNGVGVTLGMLTKFYSDRIAIGCTYSPKVHMTKLEKYQGLLPDSSIDIPETYRFGIAATLVDACNQQVVLAADGEYRRYSQIPTWANNFPGNSPGPFEPSFGAPGGPGFGWHDQWIGKVGVNYRFDCCWAIRCGYRHEQSPIPRDGGTNTAMNTLTLNTIEDYISMGATVYLDCMSEITGFIEYGFNNSIKSLYPTIDGGIGWEGANARFQAYTISLGFGYGLKF